VLHFSFFFSFKTQTWVATIASGYVDDELGDDDGGAEAMDEDAATAARRAREQQEVRARVRSI